MLQPFAKNLSFNAPLVSAFHRAGWQASVHISFHSAANCHYSAKSRLSSWLLVKMCQLINDKRGLVVNFFQPKRCEFVSFFMLIHKDFVGFLHMYKNTNCASTLNNCTCEAKTIFQVYHSRLTFECYEFSVISNYLPTIYTSYLSYHIWLARAGKKPFSKIFRIVE